MALWMVIVYFPLAHMVWGVNGWMNGVWNAGATIQSYRLRRRHGGAHVIGWSALILCLILGKRIGFGKKTWLPQHGAVRHWHGYAVGRLVRIQRWQCRGADGVAANAFMTTTIATAVASFVWPVAEWLVRGKPSVLGFCSGAVAGLVVITPACGFVNRQGALIIGIAAGLIPWFFCYKVKAGSDTTTRSIHSVSTLLAERSEHL
jgi:Amt family ammonium transporter